MDALLGQASSRFVFVTLLPTLLLVAFVSGLLAAGAPDRQPSLGAVVHTLNTLTWQDCVALLFIVVVAAVALHPIQTPLVQLLEGYWVTLPWGNAFASLATRRYVETWQRLTDEEAGADTSLEAARRGSSAQFQLDWLPDRPGKLLPTSLGNTLRAGEERAASRYGFDVAVLMPRLVRLLPGDQREALSDRRTQLDAAARLCVISLICVLVSVGLLIPTGHWLYIPLMVFVLAWACYRGAVAAARSYCTEMSAAVDLHHRDLWRALALPPPSTLYDERHRARVVTHYVGGQALSDEEARSIVWQDPPKL